MVEGGHNGPEFAVKMNLSILPPGSARRVLMILLGANISSSSRLAMAREQARSHLYHWPSQNAVLLGFAIRSGSLPQPGCWHLAHDKQPSQQEPPS